jgi:2-polyprenyl-3-methyl-5-hydroxy-6-metoxy-1,4-benzoquinol methylase
MGGTAFASLVQRIEEEDPVIAGAIRRIEQGWRTGEPRDDEITEVVCDVLAACAHSGLFSIRTMARGFAAFSDEFRDRQMDSLRSGTYRATDYEQIRREVYDNDEYMASTYYPALMLGYLASPNYRHILRGLDVVVGSWKESGRVRRVMDIASGHGLLLLFALRALDSAAGVAADLSPVAAKFSASLQRTTGWGDGRFSALTRDLMTADPGSLEKSFDAAICCELLEHIPRPARLSRADAAIPGSRIEGLHLGGGADGKRRPPHLLRIHGRGDESPPARGLCGCAADERPVRDGAPGECREMEPPARRCDDARNVRGGV